MQDPAERSEDPRLPPIGSVAQAERSFRLNWISNEWLDNGQPLLSADYVSRLGRHVRLVDVREPHDIVGSLGYLPGSDWVPAHEAVEVLARLDKDDPIVIVSSSGARSSNVVSSLRERGFRFVAALQGGVWAWRDLGFAVSYEPSILSRRGTLRPITFHWESSKHQVNRGDVERHLGDPMSIRWLKLAALLVHGRASCVDGRDGNGVFGTPGGDAGEFTLLLSAYERITGHHFNRKEVQTLLKRRIDEFGRFQLHTDIHAGNAVIKSLRSDKRLDSALERVFHTTEWRAFMSKPPAAVHDVLLEHMCRAEHLGCGHLRLSMQNAAAYGTRPELVQDVLAAVLLERWHGAIDVEYAVLPGGHSESGALAVFLEEGIRPSSRIPLISPSGGERQFFVAHPQVAGFLREQQVSFLRQQNDVAPLTPGESEQLAVEVHAMGGNQMSQTLGALAKGLPLFQIRFDRHGSITVREQGVI